MTLWRSRRLPHRSSGNFSLEVRKLACQCHKNMAQVCGERVWGCSSVGRVSDWHATEPRSVPQCSKGFFSQSAFSAGSYGVHTPPCAIACINICAHVKDPVVHVRVRWIMETLKHPVCTVSWVAVSYTHLTLPTTAEV